MNKIILSITVVLCIQVETYGQQFNPDIAEKSLVRVTITKKLTNGKTVAGVCTGFLWQSTSRIVTSLHAMKPGGTIEIGYQGGATRFAQIKSVFADADLVLLELTQGQDPPPANSESLNSYQPLVHFNEDIFAFGYNGGSRGNQTQKLSKGKANPENLINLVRSDDVSSLINIPKSTFPIYFLQGSLLPGFSGSPIFNAKGELIGIGDGGLEKGQMNVSWAIPASNLDILVNSTDIELPENLVASSYHYTADVNIEIAEEVDMTNNEDVYAAIDQQAEEDYIVVNGPGFEFFKTKNRSWNQMQETSIDPDNMINLINVFYGYDLIVDTSDMYFDVYEDVNQNILVALPQQCALVFNEEAQMFAADVAALPHGENFGLYYGNFNFAAGEDVIEKFYTVIYENDAEGEVDFYNLELDTTFNWTNDLGNGFTVDYGLLANDSTSTGNQLHVYATLVFNDAKAFFSIAICHVPMDNDTIGQYFYEGTSMDCIRNYENQKIECDFFESWIKVMGAAHLTMLSYLN